MNLKPNDSRNDAFQIDNVNRHAFCLTLDSTHLLKKHAPCKLSCLMPHFRLNASVALVDNLKTSCAF